MKPEASKKLHTLPPQAKNRIIKLGLKYEREPKEYKRKSYLNKFRLLLHRYGLTVEDFS